MTPDDQVPREYRSGAVDPRARPIRFTGWIIMALAVIAFFTLW